MPFETVMQAPGSWSLQLADDTPESVKALTSRAFSAVVVTPAPISSPGKLSATDLVGLASFTGMVSGRSRSRTQVSGFGPAWLLTLARAPADQVVSKRPLYDGSNTSWIRNNVLRIGVSESNGLSVGSISSSASPTKPGRITAGQTPLEILGDVCRRFGRNWRVNPSGTLDVSSSLFVSSPTVIATPKGGGRDLNVTGLPSVEFDERDDWDDWASEVTTPFTPEDYAFGVSYAVGDTVVATDGTYYECNTAHTSSGANLPPGSKWDEVNPYGASTPTSNPYFVAFTGGAPVVRKVVQARNATSYDDATTVADWQLAKVDQPQREITLSTDAYELKGTAGGSGRVNPGDMIYVFDPDNDLYSTSTPVLYQGRVVYPATVRVTAVREPITADRGVYSISWSGGNFVLTDLSPFVVFEDGPATVELGEPKRLRPEVGVSL